ncbi:hypothetical protein [Dapis sp. BLCC M229]|uniref:hypothetical protein n=1 Tax=Dapis sp. BLCC M229 TaxID=3400188 RepID=UPI003CEF7F17
MEFPTLAQAECYQKIDGWMEELFSDYPWEKFDEPRFSIFFSSAGVEFING